MVAVLLRVLLAAALAGCQATRYQPIAPAGGFGEIELEANVWRIRFMHNAFTTRETAQSFWLYRASEIALSKGYDGFEVLSQTSRERSSGDTLNRTSALLLEGEIRLLKKPFESVPPRSYSAEALIAVLGPYVTGGTAAYTPVSSKAETPLSISPAASSSLSGSDALKLKMMDSLGKQAPAPVLPRQPSRAGVAAPLKPTGPCNVKPVMSDQELVNCGARVR